MALDTDIVILRQVEDAKLVAGDRVPLIRIEWQVGKLGPFVERIDKAEYSANERERRLNAAAAEHRIGPRP